MEHADQPLECCKTQETAQCGTCRRSVREEKRKIGEGWLCQGWFWVTWTHDIRNPHSPNLILGCFFLAIGVYFVHNGVALLTIRVGAQMHYPAVSQ